MIRILIFYLRLQICIYIHTLHAFTFNPHVNACELFHLIVSVCADVSESFAPRPTLHSDSQTSLDPPAFAPPPGVAGQPAPDEGQDGTVGTLDNSQDRESVFDEEGILFGDRKSSCLFSCTL